jgi:hypothetical protein
MNSRRRSPLGALAALVFAGVAAALLALAGGAASAVLQDAAGDSGDAPDVTSLTVTNDARGRIAFRLAFANRPNGLEASETAHDVVSLFLNTDRNASTGDPDGDDYLLQVSGNGFALAPWRSSRFTPLARADARATRSGGTATVTVASAALGRTRAFDLVVTSLRITGAAFPIGDTAPATGRWSYTLTRYCVAPNVTGRTLAAAKRAIRAAECAVGNVRQRAATAPRGQVIAQSPRAGTARPRGAKVHLVISRGP